MNEERLIELAQKGDLTAFNQLVMQYQKLAYNVAYQLLGDPDSAADATQDGFLSAYNALATFSGPYFKAWLLRIITNRCYDELRRRKRRPQSSLEEMLELNESTPHLNDHSDPPEKIIGRKELVKRLKHCLGELPAEQRTVTVLVDIQGFDYAQVAKISEVSIGTIKSRLSRARTKLRVCLQKSGELLPDRYRSE